MSSIERAGQDGLLRDVLIVDLSDFENRKHEIGRQLHQAASRSGFFYVKGHGVPSEQVDRFFGAGHKFVELEDEVKAQYNFIPDRYTGWRSKSDLESVTGNRLWEWFGFGRYGLDGYDARNKEFIGPRWPVELGEDWKQQALDFLAASHQVAVKILRAIAISLGRDEHFFDEAVEFDHEENGSFMGINWYPEVTEDGKALPPRLHAHADMGLVTLLYQRPGDIGLEIAPEIDANPALDEIGSVWNTVPTAKSWTPIDPIEGAITVNVGDALSWWTDGLFKSAYHRVRAPKAGDNQGARLSVPYFIIPKLNLEFQGPEKKFPPHTGFDLVSKVGNAYAARKNDAAGQWRKNAYTNAYDHEKQPQVETLQPPAIAAT